MGTATDTLRTEAESIFRATWSERDGRVVPDPDNPSLALKGNDAVNIDCSVLYADLADSTGLVSSPTGVKFAAEVIRAFLHVCCRVIRARDGHIVSFDGDRVMAIFHGENHESRAAHAGLQIHYAVRSCVNEALRAVYKQTPYVVKHAVGVDTGRLLVALAGVRKGNDLVWVGRAANIAAKLSALRGDYATYVTTDTYASISESYKTYNGKSLWTRLTWNGGTIYGSGWTWSL